MSPYLNFSLLVWPKALIIWVGKKRSEIMYKTGTRVYLGLSDLSKFSTSYSFQRWHFSKAKFLQKYSQTQGTEKLLYLIVSGLFWSSCASTFRKAYLNSVNATLSTPYKFKGSQRKKMLQLQCIFKFSHIKKPTKPNKKKKNLVRELLVLYLKILIIMADF